MDAFENSDSETFSETSSEDQDGIFSIYSGQAQSILSNLEDSIGKLDDFLCFERAYAHGDIICSVADPSGQMGRIVNVNMFVDLENIFGKSVQGVESRQLCRIRSIAAGDHVVNGPWIGRVDRVVDLVGITFDDGSKSEIMATEAEKLIPISPNLLEESLHPYHPGQRVKVALSSVSKSSGWLCGMLKKTHQEGVIYSVEAGSVYVDWLAFALTCANDTQTTMSPPPPCIQDPKDLTVLHCLPHTNWLHGEYCILGSCSNKDFNSKLEDMYSIAKKKRTYDVIWQDGSMSLGLESRSIVPVTAVNATDFFTEEIVLEKASFDDANIDTCSRWGVVKYVDANEKTVKVEWKAMPGNNNIRILDGNLSEEMVSAYELVEHPDFNFSFGDIVFLLGKNYVFGQSDVCIMKKDVMSQRNDRDGDTDENHVGSFLSNIGGVVGFKDGDVQVQWASGITTQVAPYKIIRMDKDEGSLATIVIHEESVTESNQGFAAQEKQCLQHEEKDSLDVDDVAEIVSSSFGLRQAAIDFFSSIASNYLGFNGSTSQGKLLEADDMSDVGEIHEQEVSKSFTISKELVPMAANDFSSCEDANVKQKIESTPENGDVLPTSCNQDMKHFKQFDIVGDYSDHHFVNGAGKGLSLSQAKRGWLKKVQQEWSILERDLPETIYIRIYEERMDLIRAAIVGASGTPYHDGLFFFDIFLPPDYPNEPPSVYYHSGGLCLNPNLYESGRVCLSLLNTWRGTGSEVWNPGHSTILQVVVSLQALVLNEKPYFNEAGYDKQIGRLEGEKNSVSYNENAFLVTCRSMLYLLRKPPKHFEGLVEEHFQRRSKHIVLACKAYMEGTPVGSFGHEKTPSSHQEKENSTGFKIMLAKLFPKLVEAFSTTGAECSQLVEP